MESSRRLYIYFYTLRHRYKTFLQKRKLFGENGLSGQTVLCLAEVEESTKLENVLETFATQIQTVTQTKLTRPVKLSPAEV